MRCHNRSNSLDRDSYCSPGTGTFTGRGAVLPAAGLIVLAALAAYSDSFAGAFIFDDAAAIVKNPAIRSLWPPWAPMVGTNRPLGFLLFAVNYAVGGTNVWSYHVVNLAIHLAAALVLFGVVRRTLSRGQLATRFSPAADGLALAVALLWLLHPLQIESVTYIYQRFESLMGLLVLLTLYGFIRAQDSTRPKRWFIAAVGCCLLAVMTKEVAAVTPLLVLWYDRAFVASSWREIIRRRWAFYSGLAGTWVVLAGLMVSQAHKFADAGVLVVKDLTPWQYAVSQPGVIAHYLRLCFWPTGLCLDYGWPVATTAGEITAPLLLIGAIAALTVWAIFRWPEWSFVGAWFFLILAPTSSVFPIKDLAFEHRMYLPLAAVATGVVVGGWVASQWLVRRGRMSLLATQVIGGTLVILASVALGVLTFQRNLDYRSDLSMWEDTVAKAPGNARVYNSLGYALARHGQFNEAIARYQQALAVKPDYADAYINLGMADMGRGQVDEAIADYRKAMELNPGSALACNDLAVALVHRGQLAEAITQFRKALEINPDFGGVDYNLGNALANCGRLDEAITHYRQALKIRPDSAAVHYNLGLTLVDRGQVDEAIAQFGMALQIKPDFAEAHYNLGLALAARGQLDEAMSHYQKALAIKPDCAEAHSNLGTILARRGKIGEAMDCFRKALEIEPDLADAHYNLGLALAGRGQIEEAIGHYQQTLKVKPDHEEALNNLAWLRATCPEASFRDGAEAVKSAQRLLTLSGGRNANILDTLAAAYAEAGRFPEAVETARKALQLATEQGKQPLAESLKAKIPLYEAGTPFHEMQRASPPGSARPR